MFDVGALQKGLREPAPAAKACRCPAGAALVKNHRCAKCGGLAETLAK